MADKALMYGSEKCSWVCCPGSLIFNGFDQSCDGVRFGDNIDPETNFPGDFGRFRSDAGNLGVTG
jgi:hypothetical protein